MKQDRNTPLFKSYMNRAWVQSLPVVLNQKWWPKKIKSSITFTTKLPKLHFIVYVKKIKFYFLASNTRFVSGFQTCTRQIVLPHSTFIANQHPVTTSSVEWLISAWMGYDFTFYYFFVFLRLKCLIQFYKHFMFYRKKAISILFRW